MADTEVTAPVVPAAAPEAPVAPAPEAKKEPVEDPRFASKFAALSRKEKEIKQQESMLKQQLEEINKAKEAGDLSNKELAELKELAKTKRMEALRRLGISWEELSEEFLKGEEPPRKKEAWEEKFEAMEQKMKATEDLLKAKDDAEANLKKSAEEKEYNEKLNSFYTGLEQTIAKSYPLVEAFNARDIVVSVIEQTWDSSQKVLSNEEACKQVEDWFESVMGKVMSLEKVQKLGKPESKQEASPQGKDENPDKKDSSAKQGDKKAESKGPSPTLGNKSGTPPAEKSVDDMDDDEKKAYLALKLRKMRGK